MGVLRSPASLIVCISLAALQKGSIADETEIHSRAPPPARPSAAPQSPSNTLVSGDGNPFATSDDDESVNVEASSGSSGGTSNKVNDDAPGNPFEEDEGAGDGGGEPSPPVEAVQTQNAKSENGDTEKVKQIEEKVAEVADEAPVRV